MKLRVLALATVVGLAACGGAPSRPEGPPPLAIPADAVESRLEGLGKDLQEIASDATNGKLDVGVRDEQVIVTLDGDALFERGTGQMTIPALRPLAELAADVLSWGATVAHVVAFGRDGTIIDVAERRAASVAENLAQRGIARARVRSESRTDENRAGQIVVVLRPVVIGREPQAWLAPELP